MRAWIVSDIHFSAMDLFQGRSLQIPDADLCVCAGDVSDNIVSTIAYLKRNIEPHMPVLLVLGNHDHFHNSIDASLEKTRVEVGDSRIHLLENETFELGEARFIGATLWTDFAVTVGGDEHFQPEERRAIAFNQLPRLLPDFHRIKSSREGGGLVSGMVSPRELLSRHIESRLFIDRELAVPFSGPTVVVTHHAPLVESFDPSFFGQVSNAGFGSDLSDLIGRRKPSVWVHGHIHKVRDYTFDGTRVICNPVGLSAQLNSTGFRQNLIIDL